MGEHAILCVDDEFIILLALKEELRSEFGERFRYETARDAERALAAMERLTEEGVSIILVISDWLMPGMKGDEFLQIAHDKFPDTRAIMITGQADDAAVRRVLDEAKAVSVLRKPWNREELKRLIESCCVD